MSDNTISANSIAFPAGSDSLLKVKEQNGHTVILARNTEGDDLGRFARAAVEVAKANPETKIKLEWNLDISIPVQATDTPQDIERRWMTRETERSRELFGRVYGQNKLVSTHGKIRVPHEGPITRS